MKPVARADLEDALEHVSDFESVDPNSLVVSSPELVRIQQLYEYDDIDSWLDLDKGSLVEDPKSLGEFRGSAWARRATEWEKPEQVPPIVIYQGRSFSGIADGRGRVNYAIGKGWKQIPAVFARPGAMIPNAEYFVWRIEKPQREPEGPLDRRGAINDARIAAIGGRHDTAVSIGSDPSAPNFEVIRHFEARTGERLK